MPVPAPGAHPAFGTDDDRDRLVEHPDFEHGFFVGLNLRAARVGKLLGIGFNFPAQQPTQRVWRGADSAGGLRGNRVDCRGGVRRPGWGRLRGVSGPCAQLRNRQGHPLRLNALRHARSQSGAFDHINTERQIAGLKAVSQCRTLRPVEPRGLREQQVKV